MPVEPAEPERCDGARQGALGLPALLVGGAAADLGEAPEIDERAGGVLDCFLAASKA